MKNFIGEHLGEVLMFLQWIIHMYSTHELLIQLKDAKLKR